MRIQKEKLMRHSVEGYATCACIMAVCSCGTSYCICACQTGNPKTTDTDSAYNKVNDYSRSSQRANDMSSAKARIV